MRSTTPKPNEMVVAKKLLAIADRGVARINYDELEEESGYSRRAIPTGAHQSGA